MLNKKDKNAARQKRHLRMRRNIVGTAEKPRFNVYRSLSNIYAQIINDETGETLVSASTVEKANKANYGGNIEAAKAVGTEIAKRLWKRASRRLYSTVAATCITAVWQLWLKQPVKLVWNFNRGRT